jgi:hypothetical protein
MRKVCTINVFIFFITPTEGVEHEGNGEGGRG